MFLGGPYPSEVWEALIQIYLVHVLFPDVCVFQSLVRWCDSSPCKNGGSCWQQGASFTCQCASGWTGIYCDVPSVSCEVAAKQQGNYHYSIDQHFTTKPITY